jgi:hypothetical protein
MRKRETVARESGRGQPHSKTLARGYMTHGFRGTSTRSVRLRASVLECGCPLPLSSARSNSRNLSLADSLANRGSETGAVAEITRRRLNLNLKFRRSSRARLKSLFHHQTRRSARTASSIGRASRPKKPAQGSSSLILDRSSQIRFYNLTELLLPHLVSGLSTESVFLTWSASPNLF